MMNSSSIHLLGYVTVVARRVYEYCIYLPFYLFIYLFKFIYLFLFTCTDTNMGTYI